MDVLESERFFIPNALAEMLFLSGETGWIRICRNKCCPILEVGLILGHSSLTCMRREYNDVTHRLAVTSCKSKTRALGKWDRWLRICQCFNDVIISSLLWVALTSVQNYTYLRRSQTIYQISNLACCCRFLHYLSPCFVPGKKLISSQTDIRTVLRWYVEIKIYGVKGLGHTHLNPLSWTRFDETFSTTWYLYLA